MKKILILVILVIPGLSFAQSDKIKDKPKVDTSDSMTILKAPKWLTAEECLHLKLIPVVMQSKGWGNKSYPISSDETVEERTAREEREKQLQIEEDEENAKIDAQNKIAQAEQDAIDKIYKDANCDDYFKTVDELVKRTQKYMLRNQ